MSGKHGWLLVLVAVCAWLAPPAGATVVEDFEAGLAAWTVNEGGGTVAAVSSPTPPAFAWGQYLEMSAAQSTLPVLFRTILVGQDGQVLRFGGEADFTDPSAFSRVQVVVTGMEPQNFGVQGLADVGEAGQYDIPLGAAGLYMVQIGADAGGEPGQAVTARFDNFLVIPEPSALGVLVLGTLAMLPRRRKA